METNKYIKKISAYLRKQKIDSAKKDNKIKVNKIVTSIFDEKTLINPSDLEEILTHFDLKTKILTEISNLS